MSREGYTVPTGSALAAKPTSAFNPDFREDNIQMKYLCGDCGSSTHLKKADPIRCKDCGCRVLYKERTKRMIQFEAR